VLAGWRPLPSHGTIDGSLHPTGWSQRTEDTEVKAMMDEQTTPVEAPRRRGWASRRDRGSRSAPPPSGGAVYGLGMIGALVYFMRRAESGQDYVLAVGKAMVWPALLVYLAFKKLGG
jgi:hypothetical protein